MKTLELELNKRLLIVEIQAVELAASMLFPEYQLELLCKGSDLTEAVAKELVRFVGGPWSAYVDYKNGKNWMSTALESFISAIESKGWFWKDVPWDFPLVEDYGYQTSNSPEAERGWMYEFGEEKYHEALKDYEEAESRTFNPAKCIIFEIL